MRTDTAAHLEGILIVVLMNRLRVQTVTIDLDEVESLAEDLGTDDVALRYKINRSRNSCTFTIDPICELA